MFAVAWSADDRLASAAGDKSVRIWDGFTGEALGVLKGHTDRVICLAWSAKGRLASGSADASARVRLVMNVFLLTVIIIFHPFSVSERSGLEFNHWQLYVLKRSHP